MLSSANNDQSSKTKTDLHTCKRFFYILKTLVLSCPTETSMSLRAANKDHLALSIVPLINRNSVIETQQQESSYSVITITNKNTTI